MDESISNPEKFLSEFMNYSVLTYANNSLTSFATGYNIKKIEPKSFVIDGGFGEIWRNGFARKLYYFGKNAIVNKNSKEVAKYITHYRGTFLSNELLEEFYKGSLADIDEYLEKNPYNKTMSYRDYINDFCLSNRLPNYYAPEQSLLDSMLISVMSFAQQNLLQLLKHNTTRNSTFKKILLKNNAKLAEYPLAKNGNTYSFKFATIQSQINKFTGKLIKRHQIQDYTNLDCLRSIILDVLSSDEVRKNPVYNNLKINQLKDEVYNTTNNIFSNTDLDWFVSFHYSFGASKQKKP